MEKRFNTIIEQHTTQFKDNIRAKIVELGIPQSVNGETLNELIQYIYDYDRLILSKEDFSKKKRINIMIPSLNRCFAKRANGEQCSRRKQTDCDFCGTHFKGQPHGLIHSAIQTEESMNANNKKMDVMAEDIRGIIYYIDSFNNVYKTEDILSGKENPAIIAKCVKNGNKYSIPDFGVY